VQFPTVEFSRPGWTKALSNLRVGPAVSRKLDWRLLSSLPAGILL